MSAILALTVKVDRLATALRFDSTTVKIFDDTIGPPIKADLLAVAQRAFGADLKPFKNKNVRAGVGYDSKVTSAGYELVFKLRPLGVWVFGQYGAGPHDIRPNKMKYIRATGDHPFVGPVHHPGTKGKRAIDGAYKAIRSRQHDLVADAYDIVLREAWHG